MEANGALHEVHFETEITREQLDRAPHLAVIAHTLGRVV
jgi:hypothetical protein